MRNPVISFDFKIKEVNVIEDALTEVLEKLDTEITNDESLHNIILQSHYQRRAEIIDVLHRIDTIVQGVHDA